MNTLITSEQMKGFQELKRDAQQMQRKGLPFMMASVVIWSLNEVLQCMNLGVERANFFTFVTTCLLMPLAFLFSRLLGSNIFQKTENPINKLAFLCTMNQMLYLLIVMWACNRAPEAMVMIFAMVFAAHLLPYGWAYDNKAYTVISITETIGALALGCLFGNQIMIGFMILLQIILCSFLFADVKKMK
ncbi:MAG: hypothetical protein IJU80_04050 [Lachnospiraceae bacterium]|nr:hypothetical protein [Lachnospiraceae bacterium]